MGKGFESYAAEEVRCFRSAVSGELIGTAAALLANHPPLIRWRAALRWLPLAEDLENSELFVCAVVSQAAVAAACAKEAGQPEAHGNGAVYEKYMLAVVTIKAVSGRRR